jgi:hypothetical protein
VVELSQGLVELMSALFPLLNLVVEVGLDSVELVLESPETTKERLTFLGLVVGHSLDVLQLGGELDLDLLQQSLVAQKFFQP